MGVMHIHKTFQGKSIAAGTTATTWFGPILVNYIDDLSFHLKGDTSEAINFKVIASADHGQLYANDIPFSQMYNEDLVLRKGGTHINAIKGKNSYTFLTFLASASGAVGSGTTQLVITGKRRV